MHNPLGKSSAPLHVKNADAGEDAGLHGRTVHDRAQPDTLAIIAGGLVHELNNHLTMIAHTAELEQMLNDPARHEAAWKQIMELCDQARETVGRIQSLGRMTPSSHRRLNLAALTGATVKMLRGACAPRVQLHLELESPEIWVSGSENQLETVLIHLVMMAADSYAGAGGRVNVSLAAKKSVPAAAVGFPPGVAEVLWSVSTDKASKDVWQGLPALINSPDAANGDVAGDSRSGALLRKIIRAHGGWAVSVSGWEGSPRGLEISLPALSPDVPEKHGGTPLPNGDVARLRGLKVALVEDDVAEGDLLRNALIKHGAKVCAFNAAADFSRWLKAGEGPDVLITDWVLADGSGEELVRQVRAVDAEAPVVLMSGHLREGELAGGVLTGRARFLNKPFLIETLVGLLEQWRRP